MSDLVERLRKQVGDDHVRGCWGRQYACTCGCDLVTEGLLEMAAARIEALEAALRLFADDENWRYGRRFDPNGSRFDGTTIASAALAPETTAMTMASKWKENKPSEGWADVMTYMRDIEKFDSDAIFSLDEGQVVVTFSDGSVHCLDRDRS